MKSNFALVALCLQISTFTNHHYLRKQLKGRTRIAPTPSGFLHLGNLYSFVYTYLLAKQEDLDILLRIDDMDQDRMRLEYLDDIFRSLDSLGLEYQMGPSGPSDLFENWSQLKRRNEYDNLIEHFKNIESLYPCRCSRLELATHKQAEHFTKNCWSKKEAFARSGQKWRIKYQGEKVSIKNWQGEVQESRLADEVWDFAIRRKNGDPAYQLCSYSDDLHFGISHIVRGEDLQASTIAQGYLAQVLKDESFRKIRFLHHPLVKYQGEKLSKSQSAPAARYYLGGRINRERVLNFIASKLGLKGSFSVLSDLQEAYLEGKAF